MTKHTPGPWELQKLTARDINNTVSHTYGIFTDRGNRIAMMGCNQEANARLMGES